jgi:enterobactin synthetase component D
VLADGRRPVFPGPAIGSISHSHGLGVAVAGLRARVAGVGVDVELGRISLRAARGLCTPDELDWAVSAERATALFSAKESAFKALPSRAQSSVRLRDIVIVPRPAGFSARVLGMRVEGGWRMGPSIVTWARLGTAIG